MWVGLIRDQRGVAGYYKCLQCYAVFVEDLKVGYATVYLVITKQWCHFIISAEICGQVTGCPEGQESWLLPECLNL